MQIMNILSTFSFIKLFAPLLVVWMGIFEVQTTIINEVRLNNDVNIYLANCTYQLRYSSSVLLRTISSKFSYSDAMVTTIESVR